MLLFMGRNKKLCFKEGWEQKAYPVTKSNKIVFCKYRHTYFEVPTLQPRNKMYNYFINS